MLKRQLKSPVALICGFSIISITLLSLIGLQGGNRYLELLSHFQVQYLIICSILALILIFLPAKQWLIIGLSCIILILINLLPWYLPQLNSNDAGDTSLRVMIFNTRSPQNRNYAELLSWVKTTQPNLLALVEVDRNWFREFSQLEELYPYSFADLTSSPRGLVIYSQYPLNFAQVKYFSERDNPTLIAQITLGQPITVIATHPKPPRTTAEFLLRNQQLEGISRYVQTLSNPVIVLGDLNVTMWSPYYRELERLSGLRNVRQGHGILPTWPTTIAAFRLNYLLMSILSIPIDHCLISDRLKATAVSRGPAIGSDHLPLIADLVISA